MQSAWAVPMASSSPCHILSTGLGPLAVAPHAEQVHHRCVSTRNGEKYSMKQIMQLVRSHHSPGALLGLDSAVASQGEV